MEMDIVEIMVQYGEDVWAEAALLSVGENFEFSAENKKIRLTRLNPITYRVDNI